MWIRVLALGSVFGRRIVPTRPLLVMTRPARELVTRYHPAFEAIVKSS
jgi:hypothetical protein